MHTNKKINSPKKDKKEGIIKSKVFIVEDRNDIAQPIAWMLESVNYLTQTFFCAKDFLDGYNEHNGPSCLLLDIRMPNMSGLELQKILIEQGIAIPVIFMSAYTDVTMAIDGMKLGAIDFLTKPVREQELLDSVNKALNASNLLLADIKPINLKHLFNNLTPREIQILELIVSGKLNKQIADSLNISQKTVELHRTHIKKKISAKNTADLVRIGVKILQHHR